jgi:hypothetical protein
MEQHAGADGYCTSASASAGSGSDLALFLVHVFAASSCIENIDANNFEVH